MKQLSYPFFNPRMKKQMDSQSEPIRDPDQRGVVSLDVIHLRDLRRAVSEQVRHLFRREAEERTVRPLCGGCLIPFTSFLWMAMAKALKALKHWLTELFLFVRGISVKSAYGTRSRRDRAAEGLRVSIGEGRRV